MPTTEPPALRNDRAAAPESAIRSPGDLRVTVCHEQGSWRVSGVGLQPMMFATGATAERAARRLAGCLASLGDDVRLEIHDRRGAPVAHIRVFADNPTGWTAVRGRRQPTTDHRASAASLHL